MSNVGDSEIGWRDDDILASLTTFGKAKLTGCKMGRACALLLSR